MKGCSTNVRFTANRRYRLAAVGPPQNRYDLLGRVSFSFSFGHLFPCLIAQSLFSNDSVSVSQVKTEGMLGLAGLTGV